LAKVGNPLSSFSPRRTNGEEDCEEGDEEGREEALSFDAPMTGVIAPPFFFVRRFATSQAV
jgi:hypothetical protein